MTVDWSWSIEMSADNVTWYNVTRDVVKNQSVSMKRSLPGVSPIDCVADVGTFSFVLDNSEANSAGLLGYYSPGHANCRSIFALNSYVRINFASAPTTNMIKFAGRIESIEADTGQFGPRETYVQCTDYMQYLIDNQTERLAVQVNKRFDELITAILPTPAPASTVFAVDPSTATIAFHLERDEVSTLMNVAQKICQSTLGKLYIVGDALTGEVMVYENRYTRALSSLRATFDNSMTEMSVSWRADAKQSKVKASLTPYSVDASVVTLGTLESEVLIRAGATETIELRLRDPNGSERISGFDFVTPLVAGTDYNVSASSGTLLGDMNASVTVTTTNGSNTVLRTITNNSGITVYVNTLIVRGKGIYPYDVIDFNFGTGNSQLVYSMPYLNDTNLGRSIGSVIYARASRDIPIIADVSFYADGNATMMQDFLLTDIGSRIKLIEEVSGVNAEGFINGWEAEIEDGVRLKVSLLFVAADAEDKYFILDDSVKGVLDNTTYLLGI